MNTTFDFSKVKVSKTKYDIVHLVDLVSSYEIFKLYYEQKLINESILKSFVCVKTLNDPIPSFWNSVFKLNEIERKLFACFWSLFLNGEVARNFATRFVQAPLQGVFIVDKNSKTATNIRSLLVESGVSEKIYRRKSSVPFDGSVLLNSQIAGEAFRMAFDAYLIRNSKSYDPEELYEVCEQNEFHKVFGIPFPDFKKWLDGEKNYGTSIRSLEIKNFLCYNTPCRLDFANSKEIYFVGENGDGKTVLLMALFMAFMGNAIMNDKGNSVPMATISKLESKLVNGTKLEGRDNHSLKYTLSSSPSFKNFFAYGTHRSRYSVETDKSTYERYGFMTLFDNDMTLHDPTDWILKQKIAAKGHKELSSDNLCKVLNLLLEKEVKIIIKGSNLFFEEKGYQLSLNELSDGYRSIVIFVCDLLSKLSERCGPNDNVFDQPGVVLVDEICLYLHPRCQRTIVKKLRNLFKNIQFIMTTHSPVIVLGASEDAIFYRVVREEGNTNVSDPYYRKDMDDWMLNTLITSSLFGLESAAMDDNGNRQNVDTSDTYLMSRIEKRVDARIAEQKKAGKYHFTDSELDAMIDGILNN